MRNVVSISRRSFLAGSAASMMACAGAGTIAAPQPASRNKICAFVKFLQTLSYDQLADTIAELGFDGIEATIRDRGQIEPERVEEELPKLVEALSQRNLEITVMASSVNSVDQPHTEKVLRTAAGLGVKLYRMANYKYDLKKPIWPQLRELKPVVDELVALNREVGISAVYQNHSGARYVGAPVWDLQYLMRGYPANEFGIAFDIRHATVEGGLAWPLHFNLMKPHLGAVYVKDHTWEGRRAKNVPLGQGQVDPRFFGMLNETGYSGPISLHIEYLEEAGVEPNIDALRNDLKTLRSFM